MTDLEFIVCGILAEAGDVAGSCLRTQALGVPGMGGLAMYGFQLQLEAQRIRGAASDEAGHRLRRRGWVSWQERQT